MFNCSSVGFNRLKMAQRSITSYFSKPLGAANGNGDLAGISPKRKHEDGSGSGGDGAFRKSKKILSKEEEDSLQVELAAIARTNKAVSTNIGLTWFKELKGEFSKGYFKDLGVFLGEERRMKTIFPPEDQVYTWTTMTSIYDIKVVILGQDPYHGPRQAHGLCFSVQKGVDPPPSLKNMYRELAADISDFMQPEHGDLTGWAKQGVLLLNACLTVRSGSPNSHADHGWEKFTDAVIKWLNSNCQNLVFILWGNYAQKKGASIDSKRHLVLKAAHPSPLSVHRGFFGCKNFSKANTYLESKGKTPINWGDLP
ncbi:uracil-DNA glycosylase-like [Panonychus citri]|uniref:uracil-DNA glycosylase-like n=1 Tax=Panonychus citri TaxID=50023 RepID=UPI002307BD6D|nr:uracil-DNA glycosylase-like [Panonychus citri]